MFGTKTAFNLARKPAVQSFVGRAIETLQNFEQAGNKSVAEVIQGLIAKEVTNDPDVQFILTRITQKIGYTGTFAVIPDIDEDTLLISGYVLATNGEAVIESTDMQILMDTLTGIVLEKDENQIKGFISMVDTALKASKKK